MKLARILSSFLECFAALLAAYSLCVAAWMLITVAGDIFRSPLFAGPGGMPGNAAAGVGLAMVFGSGIVAAALAYVIALVASLGDNARGAGRVGNLVQRLAIIGIIAPFVIFFLGMLLE